MDSKKASKVNVIDHRTCPLLLGDFCHYDFLMLQYIWHRTRYVSPQKKITLYITYVTYNLYMIPKIYSIIFGVNVKVLLHNSLSFYVPFLLQDGF